ncbi:ATP-binding protein [Caminibacter profundus]
MKLPIGIQSFEIIRSEDYVYVDKTQDIFSLINSYKYVFLARPRRFGKSLLLDTMKCLFEGKKELFKGLFIYDKWEFQKYPVIKISWDGRKLRTISDLEAKFKKALLDNQKKLEVECESNNLFICFEELIQKAKEKHNKRVVILIDEYDKPILDVIENLDQAKKHREFIKGLYSIIKGSDEYIQFAFLTGVSKFSKASIFSGLNMLSDISLLSKFGNICGITEEEIINNFQEFLVDVNLEEVKDWYNGYYFLKDKVFNPFDLLQYFQTKEFKNYWFSSGNPSFLIKLIQKNNYYLPKISNLKVDEKLLDVFDVENIDIEVLLYQAGYLTIKSVQKTPFGSFYTLYFPNKEVKVSFSDVIVEYLYDKQPIEKIDLYEALINEDIEKFIDTLKQIFASIPYNNLTYIKSYEGFYASVVYTYLQALGFDIIGEDVTNKGRIDLSLFVDDKIYIIEFKVISEKCKVESSKFQVPGSKCKVESEKLIENRKWKMENEDGNLKLMDNGCGALEQIKKKKYYEKYLNPKSSNLNPKIYLLGICFNEKEKNITKWEFEQI